MTTNFACSFVLSHEDCCRAVENDGKYLKNCKPRFGRLDVEGVKLRMGAASRGILRSSRDVTRRPAVPL